MYINLITLFEETVQNHLERPAIYWENTVVSYAIFNRHINQCAWGLRQKGVTKNTIVGLYLPRSYEMMVYIFAVLKAGGAYLPIDSEAPALRRQQIIKDSQLQLILVQLPKDKQEDPFVQYIAFEEFSDFPFHNLTHVIHPKDLAYIMYTSGSTGTPKGVMIDHQALLNRILWMQASFPIQTEDVLFQKTTYRFDVSVWEIIWWAITGASVVLLPQNCEHDVIMFTQMIHQYHISVIHFVPSVLKIFLDYVELGKRIEKLHTLKLIFSSGEVLDVFTVQRFFKLFEHQSYCKLINLYGPTEATIDVTYHVLDKQLHYQEIPIGKPIHNLHLFVLDEEQKIVAPNEVGELYISGVGISKGYLNQPELTKQAFIPNPYLPDAMMYKTGDFVKYTEQGEYIFIGRRDFQVKIRGVRIELLEIQHHLMQCPLVHDVTVLCQQETSELKIITAYIIPKGNDLPSSSRGACDEGSPKLVRRSIQEIPCAAQDDERVVTPKIKKESINTKYLTDFLAAHLPKEMIPSQFIFLNAFPIKKNGKLDIGLLKEFES